MLYVNESGLYKLIMKSKKPIAQKFQEWICEEILPSIRKTGSYTLESLKKQIEEKDKKIPEKWGKKGGGYLKSCISL